eukprot:scaffold8664_cov53-Cylindrotheca_fusiformis.AAC.6
MSPNRSSRGVSQQVDQFLLRHLLVSENRFETFSFLEHSVDYHYLGINREQLKNRFNYLRRKQRTEFKKFLHLVGTNGIRVILRNWNGTLQIPRYLTTKTRRSSGHQQHHQAEAQRTND